MAKAKGLIDSARKARSARAVNDAFVAGKLSSAQVAQITSATSVSPGAASDLVATALSGTFSDLVSHADQVRRQAAGEDDARGKDARAHKDRRLCVHRRPRGGIAGEFVLTDADWARCVQRLGPRAERIFDAALRKGLVMRRDAAMADALVDLLAGAGGGATGTGTGTVRIDAGALLRGYQEPGETCEIQGVGTVSVSTARRLLGDCLYRILVTDGADVTTVTGLHRTIPAALRAALEERDRSCVVPGCDAVFGLEIDHWRIGYAFGGPTSLENLARVCKAHHDLHTYHGWRLAGGPGKWEWIPPATPVSPEEVARAKSRWAEARDGP